MECKNPNHPKKGSMITVEPIRDPKMIWQIKEMLLDKPLYLCLFVLGINTNLRASDLLALKVAQVMHLKPMDDLVLKEKKTGKERRISLNKISIEVIQRLILENGFDRDGYLFVGQRGLLTVPSLSTLVKSWCRKVGLEGNYGSHTLRKTWAFQQYKNFKVPLPILMRCLNHSSERQTLAYIGIQPEEVKGVYNNEI
jgi:integrase